MTTRYPIVKFSPTPAENVAGLVLEYTAKAVLALSAADAADVLTASQLLQWSVVRKNFTLTANRALTLPAAADLVAAIGGAVVGVTLDLCVLTGTLGAGGDVVVTAGTGGTVVGSALVDTDSQACFRIRLTNVTAGAEAYTATRITA